MAAAGIFVADCSVSIAWLFDQQPDTYTEAALDALVRRFPVAPRWWQMEVLNVLLALERRNHLGTGKAVELLRLLQGLAGSRAGVTVVSVRTACACASPPLTAHRALYLETALSTGLPLATRKLLLHRRRELA